jgi:hypothetical protein
MQGQYIDSKDIAVVDKRKYQTKVYLRYLRIRFIAPCRLYLKHILPLKEAVAKPPKMKFFPSLTTFTMVSVGFLSSHLL